MSTQLFYNSKNEAIARISSFEEINAGVSFYSSNEDYLQVATSKYATHEEVKNHTHHTIERSIKGTHEVLVILKGSGLVRIYNEDRELENEIKFKTNDIVSLFGGSHGIEFLEETSLIEIKQGPYLSEAQDKIKW
jgi:hypothetical protein